MAAVATDTTETERTVPPPATAAQPLTQPPQTGHLMRIDVKIRKKRFAFAMDTSSTLSQVTAVARLKAKKIYGQRSGPVMPAVVALRLGKLSLPPETVVKRYYRPGDCFSAVCAGDSALRNPKCVLAALQGAPATRIVLTQHSELC